MYLLKKTISLSRNDPSDSGMVQQESGFFDTEPYRYPENAEPLPGMSRLPESTQSNLKICELDMGSLGCLPDSHASAEHFPKCTPQICQSKIQI